MTPFQQLGLSDEILRVIDELGFEEPTNIQRKAIPYLLTGDKDFIGLAQTGTGKTAAFGIPLLEQIDTSVRHTQALVLSPTRELGQQIAQQLHMFSKYKGKLNVVAVYGGASIVPQMKALKQSPHVIIATPGRLIDLINRRAAKLDQLKYLVLDEADELMNMGFQDELDTILETTPDSKQTWLFSATMPKEIRRMVHKYMDDPYEVKVNTTNEVNVNIDHQYTVLRHSDKTEALMRFLDADPAIRAVVFCRTKRETQALAEDLLRREYKADALHGDLSQAQRDRVMKRFRNQDLKILIATDVAARGIDVNDLTHVFHHSLPDENAYYTHRSGRTARAGKKGISLSFVSGRELHRIRRLEKDLSISFSKTLIPDVADIIEQRIGGWSEGILNTSIKGRVSDELAERVVTLFGNLSKEEIITKFLVAELNKIDLSVSKDLNDHNPSTGGGDGGGRGRGRGRGRGGSRYGGGGRRSGGGGGGGRGRRTGGRRSGGGSGDGDGNSGSSSRGGGSSRFKSDGFKKKKRRKK